MLQTTFEVNRKAFNHHQFCQQQLPTQLAHEHVVIAIDKFALTANNISYAVMGDYLGYWKFFPASQPDLGRIPVMGYGEVVASNHSDIKIGERLWGFFPMASHVEIHAGKVSSSGFYDISEYRAQLAPLYSYFEHVANSPTYNKAFEDLDILLRGLYTTAWLIEDFFFDNGYFGAQQYLITSASSKTSIALAHAIKKRHEKPTIGITSSSRVNYVASLGCFDKVISYNDLNEMDSTTGSVLVDMAGNKDVISKIHHHFDHALKYSCRVGVTHFDKVAMEQTLPGPVPELFFAPHQMQKRSLEWGKEKLLATMAKDFYQFMLFSQQQFSLEHLIVRDDESAQQFSQRYLTVLQGKANANTGYINKIEGL
ncbi:hypothetical protein tloyanaT_20230 [Thalassotalea loyana]|uniref:DUF2855 family protein n=1 Tax=Thalassotalea loyana TaxID=280483 RepID=A0ABQ6HFX0_9GAMM|nr:DUF2855 family protein [Thalassotalea loyana]GLX85771.1 hypothetical protein tloyanaT_20230 [Thalassotalea loyana]